MNQTLPNIGSFGNYEASEPFNNLLEHNSLYTCRSLRTISDIVATGIDVWAKYYEPYEVEPERYAQDVADNITIVGLQSGVGVWTFIPATFLTKIPVKDGEMYVTLMLGVSLGAIPDSFPVAPLITSLEEMVQANVGIKPQVKAVAIGQPSMLASDQHERLKRAREAAISELDTDFVKVKKLTDEVERLKQQNKILADALASKMQ